MNENTKKDYGLLIAQKAERLVTGLYLVTDLIDTREPLKGALRNDAIVLLASINTLAQPEVKDRITEYKVSLRSVTEIISLLHVGSTAGIVSEMNGRILMDGFRSLQLVLEKKQPLLTKEMLVIDEEAAFAEFPSFTDAITGTSYDALTPGALRRSPYEPKLVPLNHESKEGSTAVDDNKKTTESDTKEPALLSKGQNEPQASRRTTYTRPISSYQSRKQSRKEQILSLFVKGVDVSIKDIALRIKGCSEKTIQRELNTLVYDRVIERIGEKRWSRYVLR